MRVVRLKLAVAMGSHQTEWEMEQLDSQRSSGRLHVLAIRQTSFRRVSRAGLQLQLCKRSPKVNRYERRFADWYSLIAYQKVSMAGIRVRTVDVNHPPMTTEAKGRIRQVILMAGNDRTLVVDGFPLIVLTLLAGYPPGCAGRGSDDNVEGGMSLDGSKIRAAA